MKVGFVVEPGGRTNWLELVTKLMVDSVPPVSIFYPPNSHPSLLKLIPKTLPPKSLAVRDSTREGGELNYRTQQ